MREFEFLIAQERHQLSEIDLCPAAQPGGSAAASATNAAGVAMAGV